MNKTKTIKPDIAKRFLKTYKDILLFIYEERRFEYDKDKPLELYVKSAHILNKNPEYFDTWIADVKDYDKEMLDVIRKIRYDRFIYLKDTSSYSIVMESDYSRIYKCHGLNDGLQTLISQDYASFECGLVKYDNKIFINGLVCDWIYLGINFKNEVNARFEILKKSGFSEDIICH
ncbi:MAG: hypothetical protein WCP55_21945 [Lentisphaerota bacterium]